MITLAIAARFHDFNIDSIDTKLHKDAYSGDVQGLKEALRSDPNKKLIDQKNHLGCTALRLAATSGHVECTEELLCHGADTELADIKGQTPLFVAVKNGHTNCVEALLRHGANPDGDDDLLYSPVYTAAMNGYTETLKILIKYGAKLSSEKISFGNQPLHIALVYHKYDCCLVLLRAGYLLNDIKNPSHTSMFHVAIQYKCAVRYLELLYEFGGVFYVCDKKGVFPWDMRILNGQECDEQRQYMMFIKETPRSLLSSCRLAIRHQLSDLTDVDRLQLPVSLINYLKYSEF